MLPREQFANAREPSPLSRRCSRLFGDCSRPSAAAWPPAPTPGPAHFEDSRSPAGAGGACTASCSMAVCTWCGTCRCRPAIRRRRGTCAPAPGAWPSVANTWCRICRGHPANRRRRRRVRASCSMVASTGCASARRPIASTWRTCRGRPAIQAGASGACTASCSMVAAPGTAPARSARPPVASTWCSCCSCRR